MDNSHIANLSNEMSGVQVLAPYISGDYIWKSLYSHSYTLFFNCKTCNYHFEIDGWFYKFEPLECPKCNAVYSGVFGNILPGSRMNHENPNRSVLKLESFEGQEVNIQLTNIANTFDARQDHIILVIFSKSNGREINPYCVVDWSGKNSKAQYFHPQSDTVPIRRGESSEKRINKLLTYLLFGMFSVIGLGIYFLVFTPGLQLLK